MYMVETNKHPSGSGLVLAVFRQFFNGHGSTQIGALLALSKVSATCVKQDKLSSSLLVGSVGHPILY